MAHRVTLIPGDGIGPELAEATRRVLDATGVRLRVGGPVTPARASWPSTARRSRSTSSSRSGATRSRSRARSRRPSARASGASTSRSARRSTCTPTCARRARCKGLETRYEDVDLVIVRENTEDLYAGIEHRSARTPPRASRSSPATPPSGSPASPSTTRSRTAGSKVTAVHKANIMKLSDGLFLESCRTVAAEYEGRVEFEDRIVDNMCMQLVQKPELYDVLVLPNLYGDIVSDLRAGLVGGLGVAPGANIGIEAAVFEPVHGSAPKYAGQDEANPTALILSRRADAPPPRRDGRGRARRDAPCARSSPRAKATTYDLGGTAGTSEFADAVIDRLARARRRPRRDLRLTDRAGRSATSSEVPCSCATAAARGCSRGRSTASAASRIFAFVVLHVVDIYLVGGNPELYDEVLGVLREPARPTAWRSLLGAALLYHALNGLRIIIIDLWPRDDRLPPPAVVRRTGSLLR